ncbi:MAG: hypothetical protein KJ645_02825, partial [Planctomycetes bacterium]|nr:hypothetical protein [Planctomycetota bacterium]
EFMKRLGMKWRGVWVLAGFVIMLSSAPAQESSRTIRDKSDLLPASVVENLDKDDCLDLLRMPTGRIVPLFVLVNPSLHPTLLRKEPGMQYEDISEGDRARDIDRLKQLIRSWAPDDQTELPEDVLDGLTAIQDSAPAVYSCLKETSIDFLRKFFGDRVQAEDRLFRLIQGHDYQGQMLLTACFDIRCWMERDSTGNRLVVNLVLRIERLVINRNKDPQAVENIELLFRDDAIGRAMLPAGSRSLDSQRYDRQVQDAYQIAIIDALRRKVALSLWHNTRMSEKPWVFGQRDAIVSPSLTATR